MERKRQVDFSDCDEMRRSCLILLKKTSTRCFLRGHQEVALPGGFGFDRGGAAAMLPRRSIGEGGSVTVIPFSPRA